MKLKHCDKCNQATNHDHNSMMGWYCLKCLEGRMKKAKPSLTKIDKNWHAGYFDECGCKHYVAQANTKEKLINKLTKLILEKQNI